MAKVTNLDGVRCDAPSCSSTRFVYPGQEPPGLSGTVVYATEPNGEDQEVKRADWFACKAPHVKAAIEAVLA